MFKQIMQAYTFIFIDMSNRMLKIFTVNFKIIFDSVFLSPKRRNT